MRNKPFRENQTDTAKTAHEPSNPLSRRDFLRYGALGAGALAVAPATSKFFNRSDAVGQTARWSFAARRPITLNVWNWAGTALTLAGFNAVKKAFPKQFGHVDFNFTTLSSGDPGVAQKFSLALSGHTQLPDFFEDEPLEIPEFINKGVLTDMRSVIKPIWNKLYGGAQAVAHLDGAYPGIPNEVKPKLFFYREDLFAKAGIDPSSFGDLSTDGWIEMGKKLRAKTGVYLDSLNSNPGEGWFDCFVSAYAPIGFCSKSGVYDITTNRAFSESLTFLRDYLKSGVAYAANALTPEWASALVANKIAGQLLFSWLADFLPETVGLAQYGKWKAMLWPKLSPLADQRYGSDAGGDMWAVPTGGANPSLATEFLTHAFLTEKGALATFNANGQLPMLKSLADEVTHLTVSAKKPASMSKKDWLELPQHYFGPDYVKTELEAQDYVKVFSFDPKALVDYVTIMEDYENLIAEGKTSVRAGLRGMQNDMKKEVGNPWSIN